MAFGGVGETARLVASLDLKDNFTGGINSALGGLGRMETGLGRMGRGVGQVASGLDRLSTRAALAAGAGLAAVITTAASFEQAFTGVEKTVDATDVQLRVLEETFRDMARSMPIAFEDLAAIGEAGGALGIATTDLEEFTDVVARLSVSTDLTAEAASTALGQLGNVLHLSGSEFRDFGDSLVALGNAGASTESQIVEMAARFGAAGNSAGLTSDEILALSSAVASMGIQVEAGGSALSRVFNNVATAIGTSSEKAEGFADALGLSAREFRDAWERDALGTFQDFLGVLNELDQFEAAALLKKVGITNSRDVSTVRLMAQNIGFVGEQLRIAEDAQGDLNEESQKFFDTTAGQWQILKNNVRDAGVTIGNELLPLTKDLLTEFTAFLDTAETRRGLREFGRDLADGIRDVITTLRGADFTGLIDSMKVAGDVAARAFGLFRSLPPEVQALAVTAIALNKVSGGAVGGIARGLTNIVGGLGQSLLGRFGGKVGGVLAGPGSNAFNPLYVFVTNQIPGGGPGGKIPPVIPPGGILPALRTGAQFAATRLAGPVTVALMTSSADMGFENQVSYFAQELRKGLSVDEALDKSGATLAAVVAVADSSEIMEGLTREQRRDIQRLANQPGVRPSATPTGQFNRLNLGGTPIPVKLAEGGGALTATTAGIRELRRDTIRALKDGDIHAARVAQRQQDALHQLRGTFDRRINDLIPHLGKTHSALAVANRKLDDGNARQRELGQGIREARDATRSGFDANNRQLGIIAGKDFSPNVTVPVNLVAPITVSIADIVRAQDTYNVALSLGSQTRSGFKPGAP